MALTKTHSISTGISTDNLYGGPISEKTMSFSMDAIDMLTQKMTDLYSNPIEAAVRETISNAVDATMLLPESERKPVDIFTPSNFEPYFVVEDHGVGMDLEAVNDHFSEYGASTKEENLDAIGAYGFGSKAPLAYTTSFSVETVKDGRKIMFNMNREETKNVMKIIDMSDTDQPNGTKVSIPVESNDVDNFMGFARKYATYADDSVPISIDGATSSFSTKYEYLTDVLLDDDDQAYGKIYFLRDNYGKIIKDLMDCALQNNNWSSYNDRIDSFMSSHFISVLSGWPYFLGERSYYNSSDMVIVLKPGMVDFSASRDSITSNKRLENIKERIANKLMFAEGNNDEDKRKIREFFSSLKDRKAITQTLTVANNELGHRLFAELFAMFPDEAKVFDGKEDLPSFDVATTMSVNGSGYADNRRMVVKDIYVAYDRTIQGTSYRTVDTKSVNAKEFSSVIRDRVLPEWNNIEQKYHSTTIGLVLPELHADKYLVVTGNSLSSSQIRTFCREMAKDSNKTQSQYRGHDFAYYHFAGDMSAEVRSYIKDFIPDVEFYTSEEALDYIKSHRTAPKKRDTKKVSRLQELDVVKVAPPKKGSSIYDRLSIPLKAEFIKGFSDLVKKKARVVIYDSRVSNIDSVCKYVATLKSIKSKEVVIVNVFDPYNDRPITASYFSELKGYKYLIQFGGISGRASTWKMFQDIEASYLSESELFTALASDPSIDFRSYALNSFYTATADYRVSNENVRKVIRGRYGIHADNEFLKTVFYKGNSRQFTGTKALNEYKNAHNSDFNAIASLMSVISSNSYPNGDKVETTPESVAAQALLINRGIKLDIDDEGKAHGALSDVLNNYIDSIIKAL